MDERTTGLIIRTRPLTETSLIIHWLTRDFGRISTVAKGARRPKSPFQGKLDLFYLADLSFRRSLRSDLHHLHEVSVREFNAALRADFSYVQQAAYLITLIEQTTETESPIPALFEMLRDILSVLPQQLERANAVLAFEIKLLAEHGLQPDLTKSRLTSGARQILGKMIQADWTTLSRLRLTPAQTNELGNFLGDAWSSHLNKIPAGRREALHGAL